MRGGGQCTVIIFFFFNHLNLKMCLQILRKIPKNIEIIFLNHFVLECSLSRRKLRVGQLRLGLIMLAAFSSFF